VNYLPKVVMQLVPGGNRTHDLLISISVPYHYAAAPPYLYNFVDIMHLGTAYNLYNFVVTYLGLFRNTETKLL